MKSTSLKSVEFEIWPMYTIKLNTNFQYLNEKSRDSIRKDTECKFRHEEYVLRCHILTNLEVILSNVSRHLSLSLEITYPRTSTTLTRFTDLSIAQADPKASSNSKAKPSIPLTTLESSSSSPTISSLLGQREAPVNLFASSTKANLVALCEFKLRNRGGCF